MQNDTTVIKRKRGNQLSKPEHNELIKRLVDEMSKGNYSTRELSRRLNVSSPTIERNRAFADDMIRRIKIDRNAIRSLQVTRVYSLVEGLMKDLEQADNISDSSKVHASIAKYFNHLALITGLNIETTVNVDAKPLVIIRNPASPTIDPARDVIEIEQSLLDITPIL